MTTLQMIPEPNGGLRATLEHGTGTTLDDQSTLDQTRTELTDDEVELATVAGNLASRSGFDPEAAMREFGASFVLLAPAPDEGREALQTEARARTALDGNAALIAVGETEYGALWRFAAAEPDAAAAQIPANAGGWVAGLITAIQVIVLGAALLLSIPTGAGREADRRAPRRTPRRRVVAAAAGTAGASAAKDRSEMPAAGAAGGDDGEPSGDEPGSREADEADEGGETPEAAADEPGEADEAAAESTPQTRDDDTETQAESGADDAGPTASGDDDDDDAGDHHDDPGVHDDEDGASRRPRSGACSGRRRDAH